MGIIDTLRALLSRKVCTAEQYRKAAEAAVQEADADGDGLISVRELIGATYRILMGFLSAGRSRCPP